ncbi:MAG: DEAD/DEAH box helicase [Candidatus Eisenbacteria bacterium]|nr:DEAD/DEAH box helicase [Candidatus Eisenbacteria bacterium]
MSFAALGLPESITRGVRAVGYTSPTPIQREAIPIILPGHDLVAAAQTGSGKTAAFILPILSRLLDGPRALRALVLVPTRELAAQVEEAAMQYARYADLSVGAVFGGVPIPPQERMIMHEGVDVLIATPGRLLDLHGRHSVSLDEVEILVLDEADRMVDMGFAPDLQRILRLLPTRRQTLMFSATMPAELNAVAREALHNPRRLALAPSVARPAPAIAQAFYPVARHLKADLLHELLERSPDRTAIVFTRTKRGADRLYRVLQQRGHKTGVLHGDRSQSQRERALRDFKRGRVEVLVATDIASRGIDVDDVTHVINYDVPRSPDDYIHRIGRTGRMDATGDAFTLITPEDREEVAAIEKTLGRRIERIELDDFDYDRRRPADAHGRHEGHGRRQEGKSRGDHRHTHVEPDVDHGRPARTRGGSHGHVPPPGGHATPAADAHGRRPKRNATDRRSRRRM